jgi:cell division transport system permease protein
MGTAATPVAKRSRLTAWRHQHAWCVRESGRRLRSHPLGTVLTVAVMGLALALPLAFYLLLANVQHLASALGEAQSVNVFLQPGVAADGATAIAATLRARPDVAAVTLRTPQQGLDELASLRGFGDAIGALPDNPLPYVLLVEPRAGARRAAVTALVAALRALPHVDLVQDNGHWRAHLDALVALGRRVALLLAALLGAAAILVIGNTVRLDIRGRADEIAVQQWIGASAGFVRRPYLYEGTWYGLLAGLVAVGLVLGLEAALAAPVRELATSYAGRLAFAGLAWSTLAVALVIAVVLGWLGAWVASGRHLARNHP